MIILRRQRSSGWTTSGIFACLARRCSRKKTQRKLTFGSGDFRWEAILQGAPWLCLYVLVPIRPLACGVLVLARKLSEPGTVLLWSAPYLRGLRFLPKVRSPPAVTSAARRSDPLLDGGGCHTPRIISSTDVRRSHAPTVVQRRAIPHQNLRRDALH